MKKFLIILTLLITLPLCAFAKSNKTTMPYVKFNGSKFSLYFSAKSPELKSYMNEYYKTAEGYASWTELIGVHHYPNFFSPIDYAKTFKDYLATSNCPCAVEMDEENNSAILDFLVIDNSKLPIVLEFNVFRCEKSPICGTVCLQYAKRYTIMNALETDKVKKNIVKDREKYIKKIKKVEVPDLVTVDIEKGKYINHEGIVNDLQSELK